MCERNTDVSGSIAGYYYQVLLACRELTTMNINTKAVAIEAGADVRLLLIDDNKISIEAKFHKENMSMYCEDIVKTIYNFYNSSYMDKELFFSTNVAPNSKCKNFFEKWDNGLDISEKIRFVKECILRKSIEITGQYKNKYQEYKKLYCVTTDNKSDLIDLVFKEEDNGFNYEEYAFVNNSISYEAFVEKIHFKFSDKSKLDMVYEIRENITQNITNSCIEKGVDIDDCGANKILNLLIDKFYLSTVKNSNTTVLSDIKSMHKITVEQYNQLIMSYQNEQIQYINRNDVHRSISILENEEKCFSEMVAHSYNGVKKEKLLNTYKEIERWIIEALENSLSYSQLVEPFLLKKYDEITIDDIVSLYKLINQLTILSVFKGIDASNIVILGEQDSVDNINIKELLSYCFKYSASCQFRKTQAAVGALMNRYRNNSKLRDNQVFVLDLDFQRNGKPCECELVPEVLDITQTDENIKDFILFKNKCYKCTACLALDNDDENTNRNIEEFMNCEGSKHV